MPVFLYKKATQGLNYFAIQSGGKINKMKAIKLIFLADRYHLRKYGRLITNDNYCAMQYGPVPSRTKDISELSIFLNENERKYASSFISQLNQYILISKHEIDVNVLSESDIEAFKFSWTKFGHISQFSLAEITHKYPEWKKHKKTLEINHTAQMYLFDFFEDPEKNIEKCYDLNEKEKNIRIEQLKEFQKLDSFWS